MFLSDTRQPELDFLHPWAVVWFKRLGESPLYEKRHKFIIVKPYK